jgi:hypothetical protein
LRPISVRRYVGCEGIGDRNFGMGIHLPVQYDGVRVFASATKVRSQSVII